MNELLCCRIVFGNGPVKFNIVIRVVGAGDRITCFTIYRESIAIYFTSFGVGICISSQDCHLHHS